MGQTDAQCMASKHTTAGDDLNRDKYEQGKTNHENMVIGVNATTRVKAVTTERSNSPRHENMIAKGIVVTRVQNQNND